MIFTKIKTPGKRTNIRNAFNFLCATLGVLFMISALGACENKQNNDGVLYPKEFTTTFHVEIDDGKSIEILQGTSKSVEANRFSEYPNDKLQIITYDIFGNEYDEVKGISGMILLGDGKNLYPFGERHTSKEFKTGLIITTKDKYIESKLTGTQALTDVKYYTWNSKKGQGKVAFRYEFDKVLFEDRITYKNYKVSGHIISVAKDEY